MYIICIFFTRLCILSRPADSTKYVRLVKNPAILNDCNKVINRAILRYLMWLLLHFLTLIILIFILLSGVGSWVQQLQQGAPDFPFPSHIDQL